MCDMLDKMYHASGIKDVIIYTSITIQYKVNSSVQYYAVTGEIYVWKRNSDHEITPVKYHIKCQNTKHQHCNILVLMHELAILSSINSKCTLFCSDNSLIIDDYCFYTGLQKGVLK